LTKYRKPDHYPTITVGHAPDVSHEDYENWLNENGKAKDSKRLECLKEAYYRLMKKEHAAHGANVGLPGQDYWKMDELKAEIEAIKAKLRN